MQGKLYQFKKDSNTHPQQVISSFYHKRSPSALKHIKRSNLSNTIYLPGDGGCGVPVGQTGAVKNNHECCWLEINIITYIHSLFPWPPYPIS